MVLGVPAVRTCMYMSYTVVFCTHYTYWCDIIRLTFLVLFVPSTYSLFARAYIYTSPFAYHSCRAALVRSNSPPGQLSWVLSSLFGPSYTKPASLALLFMRKTAYLRLLFIDGVLLGEKTHKHCG